MSNNNSNPKLDPTATTVHFSMNSGDPAECTCTVESVDPNCPVNGWASSFSDQWIEVPTYTSTTPGIYPLLTSCSHKYEIYTGLFESYIHCTMCGEKKKKEKTS